MRYIIMIFDDRSPDPGLVPYTGVVHDRKQTALEEYLEAAEEYGHGRVYLSIV